MTGVLILGVGGVSRDIAETLMAEPYAASHRVLGYLDDNPDLWGRHVDGFQVLGPLAKADEYPSAHLVLALGSPRSFARRLPVIESLARSNREFVTVIHPTAWISPSARLGPGCVVLPFTQISSGASLDGHNLLLSHCAVNHDTRLGLGSLCASAVILSGDVRIGAGCYLGAGSVVRERVRIGDGTLVGAGAVVVADLAPGGTFVGNPARPLERR